MLTFPTQAEQALAEFINATKTVSVVTIAKRRGAEVRKDYPLTVYIFDDDTSLITQGSGKNHKAWTELP